MAARQQYMINVLSKCCRRYFLYKHVPGNIEESKVRLRNAIHRVEQEPDNARDIKIRRRETDKRQGLLMPRHKPYIPVGGWPALELDDLVLDAMEDQLHPKAREDVAKMFRKTGLLRRPPTSYDSVLNDMSEIHRSVTAGFQKIKTALKESEDRILYVSAGNDFRGHFERCLEERRRRAEESKKPKEVIVTAKEAAKAKDRVRADDVKFLRSVSKLIELLLLIKVRHLKSSEPLRLDIIGTDKDQEIKPWISETFLSSGGLAFRRCPPPVKPQPPQPTQGESHSFMRQVRKIVTIG